VGRYSTLDKLLLLVWLPIVVCLLGLHVREVARTGLAQPPVFATPPGDDGYPRVGGYPLEVETRGSGLEVGDKLLVVGGEDLRGRGYLGFMGIALEKAGLSRRTSLSYERDGVRHETTLEMRPFAVPWLRVPFLAMWTFVAAILLVRSPRTPVVQRGAIAIGGIMICQALFFGGPRWQTAASISIFFFAPLLFYPLGMLWIGGFPGREFLSRLMPGLTFWAWFTGVVWVAGKILYLTGAPFPSQQIPIVVSGLDAIGLMPFVATVTWNFLHADAVGRRRLKWAAYGGWIAAFAMISALAAPVLNPDWPWFEETLGVAGVVGGIMPLGFLIAIAAYNLLDIDRLISATASYTLLLAALFALALVLVPRVSAAFAAAFHLDSATTQLFLSVILAGLIVPLNRRLRPRVDRLFFPEQRTLESGVEVLLGEIEQTRDEGELIEAMARGLNALFHAERTFGYQAGPTGFAAVVALGTGPEPPRGSTSSIPWPRCSPSGAVRSCSRPMPRAARAPRPQRWARPSSRRRCCSRSAAAGSSPPSWRSGPSAPATSTPRAISRCSAPSARPARASSSGWRRRTCSRASASGAARKRASGAPPRTPTSRARVSSRPRATTCASLCMRSASSPMRSKSACTTTRPVSSCSACAARRTRCARCSMR
jgi:hypothetical protein